MSKITKIYARQILDSRGNPTVEVEVSTENGNTSLASVPSGASTGSREAVELRDGDKKIYLGQGVLKAVSNINDIIAPALVGYEVREQGRIDTKMIQLDGTENKGKLGANAILGVSLAVAKAAAMDDRQPLYSYFNSLSKATTMSLPTPMLNFINGGKHADNIVDFQEYMLFPLGAPSFEEAIRWASETFHHLEKILKAEGLSTSKGDEGGVAPNLNSNTEPIEYIIKAMKAAGYKPGKDMFIAIDPASSEFYNEKTKKYELKAEGKELTSEQMIEYYQNILKEFPCVVSIEDGLAEGDWDGFKLMTEKIGDRVQIVGDDLFVTNTKIFDEAIRKSIANSILIKLNQIGTLTETINCVEMAREAGYSAIISHRSGETEDTTIADLVVGLNTRQIKTGSMSRTERIAKYNRLLRISEDISTFHGKNSLNVTFKGKDQ